MRLRLMTALSKGESRCTDLHTRWPSKSFRIASEVKKGVGKLPTCICLISPVAVSRQMIWDQSPQQLEETFAV